MFIVREEPNMKHIKRITGFGYFRTVRARAHLDVFAEDACVELWLLGGFLLLHLRPRADWCYRYTSPLPQHPCSAPNQCLDCVLPGAKYSSAITIWKKHRLCVPRAGFTAFRWSFVGAAEYRAPADTGVETEGYRQDEGSFVRVM